MRKFKVVMITSYFDRNGVTSQVINYATNLDKNKFQVAIAAGEPYDIGYEKACQENNIELCKLPQKQKNAYMYYNLGQDTLRQQELQKHFLPYNYYEKNCVNYSILTC